MPLDDALAARMAEPDFWPLYLFDDDAPDAWDDEAEEQESHATVFTLGDGVGLELRVELAVEHVNLAVATPDSPYPATVGWDDQAHFHPHVMPWPELDLLCRAVALHDPRLRHPGPMLALLCRFAFLAEDDDLDQITPLVEAAVAATRPGPGQAGARGETRAWFDLRDLRGTGITWTVRPDGYLAVEQRDDTGLPLYSMRAPDDEEFPFAAWSVLLTRAHGLLAAAAEDPSLQSPAIQRALDRCRVPDGYTHLDALVGALTEAGYAHPTLVRALTNPVHLTEAAWVVETLAGLPQGELVGRWSGPSPLAVAESWRLSLTLPATGRPPHFGQKLAEVLSTALEEAGIGWAKTDGGAYRGTDRGLIRVADHLQLLIRDDLTAGISVVSRILHAHHAAETATLRHFGTPYEPIPLDEPQV